MTRAADTGPVFCPNAARTHPPTRHRRPVPHWRDKERYEQDLITASALEDIIDGAWDPITGESDPKKRRKKRTW